MLALVKVNFACLSTLRTPPTDDLKTCFKMFKQILTICKDKQIENDQLIAFCLGKHKHPIRLEIFNQRYIFCFDFRKIAQKTSRTQFGLKCW